MIFTIIAGFYSFLIPGYEQFKQGSFTKASIFLSTEIISLGSIAFNQKCYSTLDESAFVYAIEYAHANKHSKSLKYMGHIEEYNSLDEYRLNIKRKARLLYPENLSAQKKYILSHDYPDSLSWCWDDTSYHSKYWQMRVNSRKYLSRVINLTGIIVLNHIISGLDGMNIINLPEIRTIEFYPVNEGLGLHITVPWK